MTERKTLDDMTSDDLDQLYDQLDRVRQLHQPVGVVAAVEFGESPDCAAGCGGNWPCPTYAAVTDDQPAPAAGQATEAETATSVRALADRWVKAGPPPLGVSLARWWDMRLAELHKALLPTGGQAGCRCHTGDELCSGCHRCPGVCHGCDGPEQPTDDQAKEQQR